MTEREKQIYSSINFYERYSFIIKEYKSEERLENLKKELVENIFKKLNLEFKYFSKEKFYQIKNDVNNVEFILNLIFRFGRVEPVFFAKSKISGIKIGSVAMSICKQLDMLKGIERPQSLGAPTFSNYEELNHIVEDLVKLFDDFKLAVLKSNILLE